MRQWLPGAGFRAESGERFAYDAFISYSRAADRQLALALQQGLHTFARPWYRLRALRAFRDEGSLAAGARLWGSIQRALDSSRFLILLASEQSATAPWVEREVEHWCTHRGVENVLIVLTDPPADGSGRLPGMAWDGLHSDFDWERTTALPRCLAGRFQEEPHAVPLGWARSRPELSMRDAEFRTAVAGLAAPLHGVDKDRLIGEDVRQHRRTRRHVRLAIAVLTTLTVTAASAAVVAVHQRDAARRQTALAEARQYVAQSRTVSDPYAAVAFALAAEQRVTPALPEARAAFGEAGQRLGDWGTRLVGEVSLEQPGGIAVVRWSGDGSRVWTAGFNGVSYWSVREGRSVVSGRWAVDPGTGPLSPDGLKWGPDGRSLLVSLHDAYGTRNWYLLRDAATGRVTAGPFPLSPGEDSVEAMDLAPRGDVLAAASQDGIRRWDVTTGRPLEGPLPGSHGFTYGLTWSPDGTRLAAASRTGLAVWDARQGTQLWAKRTAHPAGDISWSPDGRHLATACSGAVQWWDADTGTATATDVSAQENGLENNYNQVRWSPDGTRVAASDFAGTIRLWDARTGTRIGPPLAQSSKHDLDSFAWSPDSRYLVGVFVNGGGRWDSNGPRSSLLRLWEVQPPAPDEGRLPGPTDNVLAVAWSPDGRRVAAGSADDTVQVWDPRTRRVLPGSTLRPRFPSDRIKGITWDPAGRRLLRVGYQGLETWTPASPAGPSQPWWGSGDALTAAWSPDGRMVASGTSQGQVSIWDPATGRPTPWQPCQTVACGGAHGPVQSVVWSPDGRRLAAARADGSLYLWDLGHRRLLGPAPRPSPQLARAMAWSPDGRLIAVSGADGTVHFRDGDTGKPSPIVLKAGDDTVEALAWSPDSTRLATGDGGGTIEMWDPLRGLLLQRRDAAHPGGVTSLSWSPDGDQLVSGGEDRTVRLWRGYTEQQICRLVDPALHRTPGTPALSGVTGAAADICAHPSRLRNYPVLPLLPAR
ncbi:TIR domain-containing protein [Streptantibioticus ferralitis]|uniref:TIR domain-containing protein n=1 Tax=Streptantibioticus ferralitis TaxID=236510 RepID=A0ABT5ZCN4_9ACTN|nr:TIR domain-containing protein [Streptantibioticus ferralitis]